MRKQLQVMWVLMPLTLIMLTACITEPTAAFREGNKAIIREFVTVMNDKDFDRLDNLLTQNFARYSQATPDLQIRSREDFKQFAKDDATTFPDNHVTLESIIAEGNKVAFYATYRGTQDGPMGPFPPSGKQMELEFSGVFRLEGGKIAELQVTWDNIAVLAQLGYFPLPDPPMSVIEALEAAHNAQDVDAIVALYAEDGVETNGAGTFSGAAEISRLYDLAVNKFTVDYTNYQPSGDKVLYDAILDFGGQKRGERYEAVVQGGKIKTNFLIETFTPE